MCVYRGDAEAQKKYWQMMLYAVLFRRCIAEPIVRYKTVAEKLFDGRDEITDRGRGCTYFCLSSGQAQSNGGNSLLSGLIK